MMEGTKDRLLITFDLGGVVVRVHPTAALAAADAGVPWRDETHPMRLDEIDHLLTVWQEGTLDDDAFFAAWADAFGGRFDANEARRISERWLAGEIEGVYEVAAALRDRGHTLGCLSNTCNHHWRWMLDHPETFPTVALFEHLHASHLFGIMKPRDEIYVAYERAVGASGASIVFFDDRRENIDAALRRGWRAFHIDPRGDIVVQLRDCVGML